MDIREIEDIIDILHKNHPAFSGTKEQLMYELLSAFEDKCSIAVMKSVLNPLAIWNGGAYGIEASLITTVVLAIAAVLNAENTIT